MNKKVVKEVIVVEGIHDKQAIDRAVIADCIMTQGSTLSEQTLKMIERAQKTRGVIVFTDPDYVGERLRKQITQRVPEARHAFLPRALATKEGDIGIENASPKAIIEALDKVRGGKLSTKQVTGENEELIPWAFMLDYGLVGQSDSKARRIALADALQIGYANGKQFWNRLNALRISYKEILDAMTIAGITKVRGASD
ncbi:ribonuclease M5 [Desulfuribacillus alkaliarsenatis]|uniref:Ribonuclease M5 n=1 Tax=Desulfuribacillus alkaliarsenatis TaxID=766136 RepID=A0A1E5FZ81_9FIRM|nr:ribonuclease M5 [Desulfuribacillus alkaliarsenatis]OEF95747.1 ribonuclease M5 [Desulfuribacillus alkaliarsenatis]